MVIARDTSRPYHPGTAALAIEVSWSSLRRDLNRKAALYAEAGIGEYWVFDLHARRVVVHRAPRDGRLREVREARAGERIAGMAARASPTSVDVDDLSRRHVPLTHRGAARPRAGLTHDGPASA